MQENSAVTNKLGSGGNMDDRRVTVVRLYPNATQCKQLLEIVGSRRWVFNTFLSKSKALIEQGGERILMNTMSAQLTQLKKEEANSWLRNTPAIVLVQALRDLDTAFKRYASGVSSFPVFCKKVGTQSARMYNLKITENTIAVPLVGTIRCRGLRDYGMLRAHTVTVSTRAGLWFASVTVRNVRLRTRKSANSGTACGVDVGVAIPVAVVANDNAVTRFGSDFVAKLNEAQRRRAKAQRVLARKKTGSANHAKQKLRVQRAFLREVFLRNNFHEKTSSKIASRFSVVCAEDLKVKSLYRNNRKMKRRRSNRDLASMGMRPSSAGWNRKQSKHVGRTSLSTRHTLQQLVRVVVTSTRRTAKAKRIFFVALVVSPRTQTRTRQQT
jgi:putative transposase